MTITATTLLRATARPLPAALALTAALAGCAGANEVPSAAPGLAIVVGVHQNAQTPGVPEAIGPVLDAAIGAGEAVVVIAVDGTPDLVLATTFPVTEANGDARREDIEAAAATVIAAIASAEADADGSDVVAGISMAADEARALGAEGARIVVIDSGLPDTGSLDMTLPGMLAASPAEVADFLAAQGALPDLGGFEIELVGFGYVSEPQPRLPQSAMTATLEIWTAVLDRAGAADVTVTPAVRTGAGPDTAFTTRIVTVPTPPPPPVDGREAVYDDTSALSFQPDSTTLRDPAGAREVLADLADWLAADPGRRADVTGTTSSAGTEEGRATLSVGRAEAIKALLVSLGASAGQITAHGAGYTASPPDRTASGALDPAAAALNRTVRISTAQ